jgi:hypothetical protein
VICQSRGGNTVGDNLQESFAVDLPLAQLREFRMLTRPLRDVVFTNVLVKPYLSAIPAPTGGTGNQ